MVTTPADPHGPGSGRAFLERAATTRPAHSLDWAGLPAYTGSMSHSIRDRTAMPGQPSETPCLCTALRRASRAVTRLYDAELRGTGLRVTQNALLSVLSRSGEVRQGDLGAMTFLDETTLTRSLRPLERGGWVALRAGSDRREKLVSITEAGKAKLDQARPAWSKAQERMRRALPRGAWETLFAALPEVAQVASAR
jgi:DNA-binding MarR family transcriptional regulator